MPSHQDFEEQNARAWDEESSIAECEGDITSASDPVTDQPCTAGNIAGSLGTRVLPRRPAQSPARRTQAFVVHDPSPSRDPGIRGRYRDESGPGGRSIDRGEFVNRNSQRQRRSHSRNAGKGQLWAEPKGLITTQKARDIEAHEKKKRIAEKYIAKAGDENFPSTGYYLWPRDDVSPNVKEMLGVRLEVLDLLRLEYKVWIEWDESTRCIIISSRSQNADTHILPAIEGIRREILNIEAKERQREFAVTYMVIPPTADVMTSIVSPRTVVPGKYATDLTMTGEPFTDQEKAAWIEQQAIMSQANYDLLHDHLVKNLMDLAPYRGWMRMRVHFGHLVLTQSRLDFRQSKSSFEKFAKMMKESRTTGRLERQLEDATIAMKLRENIINCPSRFHPVEGNTYALEDVKFKNVELVFVTMPDGQLLRIEADIDRILDIGRDEYQTGSFKVFLNNRRNKRVELTTVDIERQIDWSLEVITDNALAEWPKELMNIVTESVSAKTLTATDPLGLEFPQVQPRTSATNGIQITQVVVRSVVQYKMQDSGYIVEVAIYRTWEGKNSQTEPKMATSVSMFHPSWELEMESIENTTRERNWSKNLSQFFDHGVANESDRLKYFLSEIECIQGHLSAAAQFYATVCSR